MLILKFNLQVRLLDQKNSNGIIDMDELASLETAHVEAVEEGPDGSPDIDGEGDETISLSDVLSSRDFSLSEEELWALCRECCLVLDVVKCSPEMFQTLCITPDTVAFDGSGNVCFLDLETGIVNMALSI